ncbi:uncharacterized protein FPOAC1_013761 [Fusarium poae]|uniref:uncharacterized protein n=1 Tax=Fusarium poae TaxID=36050 RepID=UPI001D04A234|nr:uncharacterized protein FPOAC1_013761 [Fusarium poae]KAG8664423.1 hypothetical protein FPOAC1_013761 [Fusarium poae]
MESPVPTSPSSPATSSTPLSFKTPTPSPAPTLLVSTPSPVPLQYPEPPDEFVQDNITYLNREKTTKKAARLGSSYVWKYGLRYIRDSDKKEVYYCHECAAGKHKQELFIINGRIDSLKILTFHQRTMQLRYSTHIESGHGSGKNGYSKPEKKNKCSLITHNLR